VRCWRWCCEDGGFHRLKRLLCHGCCVVMGDDPGILGGDVGYVTEDFSVETIPGST
jgi:hypothetical protein